MPMDCFKNIKKFVKKSIDEDEAEVTGFNISYDDPLQKFSDRTDKTYTVTISYKVPKEVLWAFDEITIIDFGDETDTQLIEPIT